MDEETPETSKRSKSKNSNNNNNNQEPPTHSKQPFHIIKKYKVNKIIFSLSFPFCCINNEKREGHSLFTFLTCIGFFFFFCNIAQKVYTFKSEATFITTGHKFQEKFILSYTKALSTTFWFIAYLLFKRFLVLVVSFHKIFSVLPRKQNRVPSLNIIIFSFFFSFQHIVALDWLGKEEMVIVSVCPLKLAENLPPTLAKKFGT